MNEWAKPACSGILVYPILIAGPPPKRKRHSQCKINNTRKDIFHDAAHVLGP